MEKHLESCPACGAGRTHKSWTKMNQRCHRCSLRFERIIGHALGYIGRVNDRDLVAIGHRQEVGVVVMQAGDR